MRAHRIEDCLPTMPCSFFAGIYHAGASYVLGRAGSIEPVTGLRIQIPDHAISAIHACLGACALIPEFPSLCVCPVLCLPLFQPVG